MRRLRGFRILIPTLLLAFAPAWATEAELDAAPAPDRAPSKCANGSSAEGCAASDEAKLEPGESTFNTLEIVLLDGASHFRAAVARNAASGALSAPPRTAAPRPRTPWLVPLPPA